MPQVASQNLEQFQSAVNSYFEAFRSSENYLLEYHYAKALESHLKDKEHPFKELISNYLKAQKLFTMASFLIAEAEKLPKSAEGERKYHLDHAEGCLTQATMILKEQNLTYTWLYRHCLYALTKINAMEGVL